MQTDANGKEALTKDINHGDAGEKPPPMAPVMTLMLYRSSRDCQPSRKYNAQEYILLKNSGILESYQEIHDSEE